MYLLKSSWFGYLQTQPKNLNKNVSWVYRSLEFDNAILILNWVLFLKSQCYPFWVHMQVSILTECEVSHSKYHNFWTTAPISVKKLQNVALIAGFNLHSFSSLNSQKCEIYGHFSGEHLFKKIAIFESTMKRTSAVHTYLNCTYSHGGYKLWI